MNAFFMSSLIAIFLGLLLSLLVFLKDRNKPINIVYSLFLFSLMLWIFGDIFYMTPLIHTFTPLFWYKVSHIGATLTPVFYFEFILYFTKTNVPNWLRKINLAICLLFLVSNITSTLFFKTITYTMGSYYLKLELGPLYDLFIGYILLMTIVGFIFAIRTMKKSSGQLKEQMKYFVAGTVFIILAATAFFLALTYNSSIRLDNLLVIIYAAIIAYSFTKKRLMDINIVVTRSMAISGTILLYGSLYLISFGFYNFYISEEMTPITVLMGLSLCILTGTTFEKLKTKLITTSEKLFIKGSYNYRKTLRKISESLINCTTLDNFKEKIAQHFFDDIESSKIHIFLPEDFENRKDISLTLEDTTKKFTTPFNINKSQFLKYITPETPCIFIQDQDETYRRILKEKKIEAQIGCYNVDKKLLCVLLLEKKFSEEKYNSDDYDLFTTLATQIPTTLLRIHQARVSAEMDVAQRIQTEILPKNPTLPKLDLACFMSPADEVGGDYYDVFQHKEKSWLVVGDVAGHGVASGLVMFMVQSIMATLIQARPELNPGDLNYLANTILCKNFERLEEDRPMTVVTISTTDSRNFKISGSHDNIYIYRYTEKKIETITVDHFPFGIGLSSELEKELFQTDTFKMGEKDILFLGTDGITEAFKDGQDTNEQFGESRLINIIENNANKSVDTIKEVLLSELDIFTKGIYFDDVTFIIAQAK